MFFPKKTRKIKIKKDLEKQKYKNKRGSGRQFGDGTEEKTDERQERL
jgi:hypothetical protein